MDRLQPLRALGSDRGVSPVEVRRREVSEEFGAREGENKGETKGEKSCTQVEKQNQNQKQQIDFHDLDGKPSAAVEETSSKGEKANDAAASEQPMANDTTSPRRKVSNHGAQEKPIESSFSTLQRTGAENVCDERRRASDQTDASDTRSEGKDVTPSTAEQLEADDTTSPRRKVETHKAQAKPIESSFSTFQRTGVENVCDGRREESEQADANLGITKRLLHDFSLTLSMARPEFFDRAVTSVNAAFAKQIGIHLRGVSGKNARKKAAAALEEYCARLVAARLAERTAKQHSTSPPDRHDDTDYEDTGDDERHHETATEYDGDAADLAEEWC